MYHTIYKSLFGKQESQESIQESRNQAKNLDSRITSMKIQSCGPLEGVSLTNSWDYFSNYQGAGFTRRESQYEVQQQKY